MFTRSKDKHQRSDSVASVPLNDATYSQQRSIVLDDESGHVPLLSDLHLVERPQLKHSATTSSVASSYTTRPEPVKGVSDPFGLQIAYQPQHVSGDIVFVHGLNGSAWKTWSATEEADSFWPQWLCDDELLQNYRVSTFGFNSKVKGSSNHDIIDFAKDLLFQLLTSLPVDDAGKLPALFFVAHSMGGLVVKKALMLGKNDSQFDAVTSRARGIVFLATPHRGAQYAKLLNNILSLAPIGTSSKTFISGLEMNSAALQDINESFRQYDSSLWLCSFYETLKSTIGLKQILVVEKDSAVMGYQGELSTAMDASHKTICKFKSRTDPNYQKVHGVLKQWAARLRVPDSRPLLESSSDSMTTDQIEAYVKKIFGLEIMADDRLEVPCETICRTSAGSWLFAKPEFDCWNQLRDKSRNSESFLLVGPPGTGKSIITHSTIEYLRSQGASVQYHVFDDTHQLKQTGSFGLRSIAAQLAISHSQFRETIIRLHENTTIRFNQGQSFQYIWDHVFQDVLFKIPSSDPIFFVLDSIDESDCAGVLLQKLSQIESRTPIKVFASCRTIKGIPSYAKCQMTTYFLQPADTAADMLSYVTQTVRVTLPDDVATQKFVQDEIMKRAAGSFLWARLAMEMLQDSWHTRDDIMLTLTQVPSGMTAMYGHMKILVEGQSPRNVGLARDILAWVVCSWRPLYIQELQEALKLKYGTFTNLSLTITQICGHFVTIDRSDSTGPRAILIHSTAKDFLTGKGVDGEPWIRSKEAHKEIAATCLDYLCNDKWRGSLSERGGLAGGSNNSSANRLLALSSDYPLLPYSTWHWAYHLSKSPKDEFEILEKLEPFLLSHALCWIEAIAVSGDMIHLIRAARYLKSYVKKTSKRSSSDTRWIQSWAIDFIRIASKFASNLIISPVSVHRNIPPLCPKQSMIGKVYGLLHATDSVSVTGVVMETWDDCIASVEIENDEYSAQVAATEGLFFTVGGVSQDITVWNSETCERLHTLKHDEIVMSMSVGRPGAVLAVAGLRKFHIWDGVSGKMLHQLPIPMRSRVQHIIVGPGDSEVVAAFENFRIERILLHGATIRSQDLDVSGLDEGYQNCPICQTISPDAKKVAMGWRGRPPLIWDIQGDSNTAPLKCRSNAMSGSIMSTRKLVWHPDSTKLYIMCQDTSVYEWNVFDDELYQLPNVKARHLSVSSDGTLLMSCDHDGTINIWTLPKLSLIYSLQKSGALVNALEFSTDNQRFYDIRNGSSCNIWEPDALIRSDDDLENEESDVMSGSIPSTEPVISMQQHTNGAITAIAPSPLFSVFASAREGGSVFLHDATDGARLRKLYHHPGSQKAYVLEWSCTGKYIASCDVSSHIIVKRIQAKEDGKWAVFPVLDFRLGHASPEFVFSPDERYLLISTPSNASVWNLKTKEKAYAVARSEATAGRYWASSESTPAQVASISPDGSVEYFEWTTGNQVQDENSNSLLDPAMIVTDKLMSSRRNRDASGHIIWSSTVNGGTHRIIATVDNENGRWASFYKDLQLKVVKMVDAKGSTPQIPQDICAKVKLVLGTIENDLLFLGFDGWVCSYNVAHLITTRQRRLSTGVMARKEDVEGFRRHFYIPRDWLNTTSAAAVASKEGTIFFPKQGEVAIVRNGLRFE